MYWINFTWFFVLWLMFINQRSRGHPCVDYELEEREPEIYYRAWILNLTLIIRCDQEWRSPSGYVSTDQYECWVKCHLHHTKGKEDTQQIYYDGNICVDHASSLISIYNQLTLGATDTIRSNDLYELQAYELCIKLSSCRGDNGIFKSTLFQSGLKKGTKWWVYLELGYTGRMEWLNKPFRQ